jgi:hypothetical protein
MTTPATVNLGHVRAVADSGSVVLGADVLRRRGALQGRRRPARGDGEGQQRQPLRYLRAEVSLAFKEALAATLRAPLPYDRAVAC